MSTWHQNRNPASLAALYKPEPGKWKCISDRPNQLASCMTFDNAADALAYCKKTGDLLVPPPVKVTSQSPRDWAEDFELENGCYLNRCVQCQELFMGYKRRSTCRVCMCGEFCAPPGVGECSCRKFGADPTNCDRKKP